MARINRKSLRLPSSSPFTEGEVQKLIATATGWWEAFVRLTWESGQELIDLSQLRWDQVASDGTVRMVRAKTGIEVSFRLSHEAIAAARAIGDAARVLPLDSQNSAHFARQWRQFVASVEDVRPLSAKCLRLAAIHRVVRERGEIAAKRLLGHSRPHLESQGE